jgi:starch-binding outer membrane protein, SusD/RagB family
MLISDFKNNKFKDMKIKKYIAISVLTCLALLTSCNDYLDTTSLSNFDSKYVFSNVDDTKKAVLGVYALFTQDSYTSRMSNVWMQNTDVEVTAPSAAPDGSRRDVWSLQAGLLTGFGDIKTAWDHNFLAIDRANQCIEGIKASAIADNKEMKQLLGESYCLRAYRYFLLTNFWGDVPYFREAAKFGLELDIPKTDKNIIYSGLIQDLVDNEENMYFSDQFSDGVERMNRDFALGFIARLALFRAGYGVTASGEMKRADDYLAIATNDSLAVKYTYKGVSKVARTSAEYYQLAKDYAEKLMELKDRNLEDYATVFYNQNKWIKTSNSDMLYEVAFGNTNSGGDVGWCVGVPVTGGSFGTTTIQVGYTPTYYFSFDRADLRRDVCITRVSYSSETDQVALGVTSLAVGKWNRLLLKAAPGAASSKGTGINWPVLRYADVLLMYAEAENELNGPTAAAKNALKKVRKRAFTPANHAAKVDDYVNNLNDKVTFFNAIVDERAWELGGEGVRRFDLIRWNNFGQKIVQTKKTLDNMGKAALGLELDNPEVAQYATLAKKIYYYKSVDGKITFLNDYYEPQAADIESWLLTYGSINSFNWCSGLYKKVTDINTGEVSYSTADYTDRCWRGYKDPTGLTAVPYLLPINTQTVSASKYLTNTGYGLVLTN